MRLSLHHVQHLQHLSLHHVQHLQHLSLHHVQHLQHLSLHHVQHLQHLSLHHVQHLQHLSLHHVQHLHTFLYIISRILAPFFTYVQHFQHLSLHHVQYIAPFFDIMGLRAGLRAPFFNDHVSSMLYNFLCICRRDGHKKKSYEKSQAILVNECGNGFMPYNVGCQNTASQIQGDENGVSTAADQTFDD